MPFAFHDLETRSRVPIKNGSWAYGQQAEVLLWAYAIDDGPVRVWDLMSNHPMPEDLAAALQDPECIHVWHNGGMFDLPVLKMALGIEFELSRVHDTLVIALAHSLPGSLGQLSSIFNLSSDTAKDKDGKKLIRLFCIPKKDGSFATRQTHPAEWQAFIAYATLDVTAMREIYRKLPKWNLTPAERELWILDQRINARGVGIDLNLVHGAIDAVAKAQANLAERTQELTYGTVWAATQRDAMLGFILAAHGLDLEDLRGSTVEKLLEDETLSPELRDLLAVRLQASTSSTAKYKALAKATSSDGRLRGTLQFCGASRTGRWAGRLFQPQNIARGTVKDEELEIGIDALKGGCADLVTGNVMELASSAIRGCIVAPEGKKLVVADLANIEGRVLAWLAGEEWKLQAFRDYDAGKGADLYKITAARILGKKPEEITKDERQSYGKVTELSMGYEGGVGAFITFAAAYSIDLDDMARKATEGLGAGLIQEGRDAWEWSKKQKRDTYGLERDTWVACDAIKRAWRYAHPATRILWKSLAEAARLAIHRPGDEIQCGRLTLLRNAAWLRIILPSGRSLCYPGASVDDSGQISYMGVNQYSRRWERLKTYGGKLVENVTQAVARDVLASAMLGIDSLGGYEISLSVHDELITEAPNTEDFSAGELARLMSLNPEWAEGLPLAAAGFEATRYRKD